ncbi:response regulator receiver modulated diguanylate cyclase [Halothiobacillus neapolitanus c2]|uniref:diguanylate cyclase n=2 Tax=Halothiobacillus neapolitanus TaxID=927 RepID=D0KZW3_HALNC|nr:response regulator receiver modulated diguanylate cyclase [Halothiobacillus neapolitanus c2]TDN66294.1 diguanylate cyclase (GGDEF)-like protein [Halothiobacillus neapolitanus]
MDNTHSFDHRTSSEGLDAQPVNWELAVASMESVLSQSSAHRKTRLVDLLVQAENMLMDARRIRQPQLANALDRLLHAIQQELISPAEDFSRLIRLIRHIDRIIKNMLLISHKDALPVALIISAQEPSDVLRDALSRAGFAPRTINAQVLNQALEHDKIKALADEAELIMLLAQDDESFANLELPFTLLENELRHKTSLLISSKDSFQIRAASAKAGVSHFLTEPLDVSRLNMLLQSSRILDEENKPLRVLMVDDMVTAGVYWGKHFQKQNINFRFESKPEQAYRSAVEMQPDIILLDLYMPDIDGIDLAKIFREHPRLLDVPILFMSTEENDRRRMNAKIQGGDDFLNKTIAIDDLLKMVRYRALRYRQSMAEKRSDSLTGLLNHNAIKDLVEAEIDRANRQNQPLSVVLIDIDHFKNVNDTFGHQAGDIVIRKLSNLLNTRLRRYDGVGRYGGEEFMITLPNTDEQTAAHLINRLRVQFGQSAIRTENGSNMLCTFSAGIASFPRFLDLTSLIEAADQHLYVAKANGRNRVVCSEEALGASPPKPD